MSINKYFIAVFIRIKKEYFLFLIEVNDPKLKSLISVRLNFYEIWLKNCIFLIQCILYFSLEDKSCSSDGASRVLTVTNCAC